MSRITYAAFNPAAPELVLSDDSGSSPMNWSFKVINGVANLKKGRGYMQELRGRFNEKGELDVRDIHNDEASDFDIVCGRFPEFFSKQCKQSPTRGEYDCGRAKTGLQTNSGFPDAMDDHVTIRVFSGPPPKSVQQNAGSIWIVDPASVILKLLSVSALGMSSEFDETSGRPGGYYEDYSNSEGVDVLRMALAGRPMARPRVQKYIKSTLVVQKRLILADVTFEVM
ncbi:MAG: hypothetical protein ACJ8F7_07115 [Gemmataceae bacterium]